MHGQFREVGTDCECGNRLDFVSLVDLPEDIWRPDEVDSRYHTEWTRVGVLVQGGGVRKASKEDCLQFLRTRDSHVFTVRILQLRSQQFRKLRFGEAACGRGRGQRVQL